MTQRSFPADAKAVANLFLDWASEEGIILTPMKIQKLLFFSHADFLVAYGSPLIRQTFEAWDYGPVIPSIYQEFRSFSKNAITSRAYNFDPKTATKRLAKVDIDIQDHNEIRIFYGFYKHLSAAQLSDMSHALEGAWRQARALFANGLNMDRRISNDLIRKFHRPPHS